MEDKIRELEARRAGIIEGGGAKRVAAQHEKGKGTARERIASLLDPGSFVELDAFIEHRCDELGMDEVKAPGETMPSMASSPPPGGATMAWARPSTTSRAPTSNGTDSTARQNASASWGARPGQRK